MPSAGAPRPIYRWIFRHEVQLASLVAAIGAVGMLSAVILGYHIGDWGMRVGTALIPAFIGGLLMLLFGLVTAMAVYAEQQ